MSSQAPQVAIQSSLDSPTYAAIGIFMLVAVFSYTVLMALNPKFVHESQDADVSSAVSGTLTGKELYLAPTYTRAASTGALTVHTDTDPVYADVSAILVALKARPSPSKCLAYSLAISFGALILIWMLRR